MKAKRTHKAKVTDVKAAAAYDVVETSVAVIDNETPSTVVGMAPNPVT